jgi:hypothetical protein
MKKAITILLILFTLTASAQKKDTVKQEVDTVYILNKTQIQIVETLLRQNTLSFNGKQLTFDDVLQLIQSFDSKVYYLPKKEQPKK